MSEEDIVAEFQREFKLLYSNTHLYNQSGSITLNNMEKVACVFHRLFNDWVLCYDVVRPYEWLDDDLCVQPNEADNGGTILLCDRCDGKYNPFVLGMSNVPNDEWFCHNCIQNRCFYNSDPRLGRHVKHSFTTGENDAVEELEGVVKDISISDNKLYYAVHFDKINTTDLWTFKMVDDYLGDSVPKLKFKQACIESYGYNGKPFDGGFNDSVIPYVLDYRISMMAVKTGESNEFFNKMISSLISLRTLEGDWTKKDWVEVLKCLCDCCSSVDEVRRHGRTLESAASEVREVLIASTLI